MKRQGISDQYRLLIVFVLIVGAPRVSCHNRGIPDMPNPKVWLYDKANDLIPTKKEGKKE